MENRNFIIGSETCTLKVIGFAIFVCLSCAAYSQVPTITSFSPTSGPAGTTVTIKGTNFAAAGDNTVYFGVVQAKVFYSTTNSLMLNVPVGASCAPISVLVNGSITYSTEPFVVTFSGGAGLGVKTDFTAGNTPTSVAMGDLDGDGYADLVVANKNSYNISVLRNSSTDNGNINFDAAVNYSTGSNSKPNAVAVGDLDNDGQLDVAIANMKTNSVSIFRNNSTRGSGVISLDEKMDFTTASKPKGVLRLMQ